MIALRLQERDSQWAEPHNNNPLEKTTLSREGITAQSKEMKDENAVRLSLIMQASAAGQSGPSNAYGITAGPHASHMLESPVTDLGLVVHADVQACSTSVLNRLVSECKRAETLFR